jgi:hypothetical protein
MSGYLTEHDRAHARDMRMRARLELLREQDDEHGEQEPYERYPSDEELEAYYADQDAQVMAYRS